MNCSFCRIHKTLRVTPAMEAGLTGHVWTLDEVALLVEAKNMKAKSRKAGIVQDEVCLEGEEAWLDYRDS